MTVKLGYKQSEVGVIPDDWDAVNLQTVCSMKSGESITSANIDGFSKYPCFGGNGLRGYTKRFTHDGAFALIGRQGALCGNVVRAQGRFFASEHAVVVTAQPGTDVAFLTYVLGRMRLNRFSESSAQPGLSVSKVLKIALAVPPNEAEQRAIATALTDVDDLLTSLDRLIAKKRAIKQGVMHDLLTGRKRLPGFNGEWEVRRLGTLGNFLKGKGIAKCDANTGSIPCVRYGEIYTKHSDLVRQYFTHISARVASQATRLQRGDILFAGSGETKAEIGKSIAIVDDTEAYAGGDIVILRTTAVHPQFAGYVLNMPYVSTQKAARGQGDAVVHISPSALADVHVALPPLKEQRAIAAVLTDLDDEIDALQARRDKTHAIKQAMMHELLTGRTRLV